jgi:hypothetical protein
MQSAHQGAENSRRRGRWEETAEVQAEWTVRERERGSRRGVE